MKINVLPILILVVYDTSCLDSLKRSYLVNQLVRPALVFFFIVEKKLYFAHIH